MARPEGSESVTLPVISRLEYLAHGIDWAGELIIDKNVEFYNLGDYMIKRDRYLNRLKAA